MAPAFELIILGSLGGPRESNLSGYLLRPLGKSEWIVLDAGSLLTGIDLALAQGNFEDSTFRDPELTREGEILRQQIKGYLISHAHLDHICALVLNSQCDQHKFIMGIDPTIDNLRDHIFNGKIWPNYGSEGKEPILRHYEYVRLAIGKKTQIPETTMSVEAHRLSHPGDYASTAFLIENEKNYFLFFGDTSADSLEKEKRLEVVWRRIGPLIRKNSLHALIIECSYSHQDSAFVVHGHLDSKLLIQELERLKDISGCSLAGLNVIVTHRKERLEKNSDAKKMIQDELEENNHLDVNFIFPTQGEKIIL